MRVSKNFDPDQAKHFVRTDLDLNCLTLWWYSWKNFLKTFILKKIRRWQKSKNNYLTYKNYHNFCAFQGSQTPELNFVKKKNLLSEEDEIDFISCCDSETFKFVVPPKKYKINILLHALVSGPMCGLCLWYLLPTTLNNIYYHNTGEFT